MIWRCRERTFELSGRRTLVMGIVNVTPDSFSDGGRHARLEDAVAAGERMVADGADLLDVGGESTRPGAAPVALDEELRRVVPVVEALRGRVDVALSVDTRKAEVARHAIEVGAEIVNDVTALGGDPAMVPLAAETGVGVVLMHMLGEPHTMQRAPRYDDVVATIAAFLRGRMAACAEAGVRPESVALDPGIGFGKTLEHNLEIFRRLPELCALGRPVLVGPSRKAFIGQLLDLPVEDRLEGTAAAVAASVLGGARIVRVHDPRAMGRVVRVAQALRPEEA